jgi:hypothetical protein
MYRGRPQEINIFRLLGYYYQLKIFKASSNHLIPSKLYNFQKIE